PAAFRNPFLPPTKTFPPGGRRPPPPGGVPEAVEGSNPVLPPPPITAATVVSVGLPSKAPWCVVLQVSLCDGSGSLATSRLASKPKTGWKKANATFAGYWRHCPQQSTRPMPPVI